MSKLVRGVEIPPPISCYSQPKQVALMGVASSIWGRVKLSVYSVDALRAAFASRGVVNVHIDTVLS